MGDTKANKLIKVINAILCIFGALTVHDLAYYVLTNNLLFAFASGLRIIIITLLIYYNRKRSRAALSFTIFICFRGSFSILGDIVFESGRMSLFDIVWNTASIVVSGIVSILALLALMYLNGGRLRELGSYIRDLDSDKSFGKSLVRFLFISQLVLISFFLVVLVYVSLTGDSKSWDAMAGLIIVWLLICFSGGISIKRNSWIQYALLAFAALIFTFTLTYMADQALPRKYYVLSVILSAGPALMAQLFIVGISIGMVVRFFFMQRKNSQTEPDIDKVEKEVDETITKKIITEK
jgi:hypothetical protein